MTETLLQEVYEVLIDPEFVGRMRESEAATLVAGFANVAVVFIRDAQIEHQHLTDDLDDDYLAHAALKTGAFLVTRDDAANFGKVEGLRVGRPGTALRVIGAFDEGEVSWQQGRSEPARHLRLTRIVACPGGDDRLAPAMGLGVRADRPGGRRVHLVSTVLRRRKQGAGNGARVSCPTRALPLDGGLSAPIVPLTSDADRIGFGAS